MTRRPRTKFKEVQEAYDVLSDEKKRKVFDRFGYYNDNLDPDSPFGARVRPAGSGARGFDFSGFDWETGTAGASAAAGSSFRDIFSDLFGGGGAAGARREPEPPRPLPKKGRDIEIPLALSFEEAFTGLTTNITVNRSEQCSRCQGAGDTGGPVVSVRRAKVPDRSCGPADGCSFLSRVPIAKEQDAGEAVFTVQRQRRDAKDRAGQDTIPAGVDTGSRVRIPKKGHGGRLGAEPGDLYICTNVGKHPFLERKGDNVYMTVPITVPEAASEQRSRCRRSRAKPSLKIPSGTESGQKFRLQGTWISRVLRNPSLRGDQFIEVKITLPKVISEETKEALRQFEKLNPENPRKAMGLE